jgi:hypothetical protein
MKEVPGKRFRPEEQGAAASEADMALKGGSAERFRLNLDGPAD